MHLSFDLGRAHASLESGLESGRQSARALTTASLAVSALAAGAAMSMLLLPVLTTGNGSLVPLPENVLSHEVLRLGVDHAPAPPLPTDYQTRREDGLEDVLRAEIAKELGIAVELVTIGPDERRSALAEGRVDALLVHASRLTGLADIVMDAGYTSGLQPIMRSDTVIKTWSDFRGHTICITEYNKAARSLAEKIGAKPKIFRDPAKSLAAMRIGECDAALHDAAMVSELRRAERWQKFSATLPQRAPSRLTIAASKENAGVAAALASVAGKWRDTGQWKSWNEIWAADIDFEVYLEQDAPDCHQ